jgi:branched-chain amino acid transport system permease protein
MAIRDDPRRARFAGINVGRHRLLAFVLSGFFSGLAGALFAFHNGSVFPAMADLHTSFEAIIVSLLGGSHAFLGPLVGAIAFKTLARFTESWWLASWPLVMGLALIAVVLLLPGGVVGLFESRWGRRGGPR